MPVSRGIQSHIVALGLATVAVPLIATSLPGQAGSPLTERIDTSAEAIEGRVIAWRRDVHQNPELGNREFRTAALVAEHLRSLGMEVREQVGHTGVVGLLHGGRPGPVVALRADMDALPVTEQVDLPFASKVTTVWRGRETGVMHACGHDNHVAILMGVAEVLAGMRDELPGSVKFVFQPAEEGAPPGEEGGADLMLAEGAFNDPRPDAVFGLHVGPGPLGMIGYRPGGFMASSDGLTIRVTGSQTHGAMPWGGVDPIVVASQIVLGLQTITSRQVDVTASPSIVTIGSIQGGNRGNIIPNDVVMTGTIRTFDPDIQVQIHQKIKTTAERIAESAGATAEVEIGLGYPVTVNDTALTEMAVPTLERVAGSENVALMPLVTASEDFSYFAQEVPGFYFMLSVTPRDQDWQTAAPNHSPYFVADEEALLVGVRAMTNLTVDYLFEHSANAVP